MTFWQALKLCLEGKRIQRAGDSEGTYIKLGKCDDGCPCLIEYYNFTPSLKAFTHWTPDTPALLATDWQVVDSVSDYLTT